MLDPFLVEQGAAREELTTEACQHQPQQGEAQAMVLPERLSSHGGRYSLKPEWGSWPETRCHICRDEWHGFCPMILIYRLPHPTLT